MKSDKKTKNASRPVASADQEFPPSQKGIQPPSLNFNAGDGLIQAKSKEGKKPGLPKDDSYAYKKIDGDLFVDDADKVVEDKSSGDGVDLNDVTQGSLADCYFLAAAGAIAQADPKFIKDAITDNGDGTFKVRFYVDKGWWTSAKQAHYETVKPNFPTDAAGNPAYADFGDKNEIWVMVLEKAFAQLEGSYADIEWGNAGTALELLTGKESKTMKLGSMSEVEIIKAVKEAMDAGKPLTASSIDVDGKKKSNESGVVGKHVYVIHGLDEEAKTIDLYNPWGSKHLNGFSIADFKTYFRKIQTQ